MRILPTAALCAALGFVLPLNAQSGLDVIGPIVRSEERLPSKVDADVIERAIEAADAMNERILEAIRAEGLANDGTLSAADAMQLNRYLNATDPAEFAALRSAFFAIERQCSRETLLNTSAVDSVFSNVYNLGLPAYDKYRTTRPDGKGGHSFKSISYYLSELLHDDLESGELANPDFIEVTGTTATALDAMVDIIMTDRGLNEKVPLHDMREAAKAADAMNTLILEAIHEEGLANDRAFSVADARQMNRYLVEHYAARWAELHGDDEDGIETGYHYIQNDGATTRMFAENVFNSLMDGIYHLGFKTDSSSRLVNEDGNGNQSFERIAWWLGTLLENELAVGMLANPQYQEVEGTTGTVMDEIIPMIYADEGLQYRVAMSDIRAGARAANGMNELIIEALRTTGVAEDGDISEEDVGTLNRYLVEYHRYEWKELHGNDEDDVETGYHRIQNDGSVSEAYGKSLIDQLADSVYHLGFETPYEKNLVNEDGKKNASFDSVAYWMNRALADEFSLRRTRKGIPAN